MALFGIICPSETGHLSPMLALGRELQKRGHNITCF
jgi:zeaxanthin glucosyltransferase